MFVGPYEHHSNLLPWREIGAEVIRVAETVDGLVDLVHLNQELQASIIQLCVQHHQIIYTITVITWQGGKHNG